MALLFPNGYTGNPAGTGLMLPLEQVAQRTTVARLHPEFWRRVSTMMVAAALEGVQLGVGTGWRVQPTNPDGSCKAGFACPGNSYHEGFMPDNRSTPDGVNDRNAMAVDMVTEQAWGWMNANCGRFGLIHFANVNSEPWHVQPYEIPRSRNRATAMPALQTFPLPPIPGAPGGYFVTDADRLQFIALLNEFLPRVPISTPWTASKTTPLGDVLRYLLRNNSTLYNDPSGNPTSGKMAGQVDRIEAALNTVNPEAIRSAIIEGLNSEGLRAALATALDAYFDANPVSAEVDVEGIAQAVFQKFVGELTN